MCEGAIALPLAVTSRHGVLLHVQYLALSTLRTIGCCFRTGLLIACVQTAPPLKKNRRGTVCDLLLLIVFNTT